MFYQGEDDKYFIVKCQRCGDVHKKEKTKYTVDNDKMSYVFEQPIVCDCGLSDKYVYRYEKGIQSGKYDKSNDLDQNATVPNEFNKSMIINTIGILTIIRDYLFKHKKPIVILSSIILIMVIAYNIYVSAQYSAQYSEGINYIKNQDYDKAIQIFSGIQNYKDSNAKLEETKQLKQKQTELNRLDEAYKLFYARLNSEDRNFSAIDSVLSKLNGEFQIYKTDADILMLDAIVNKFALEISKESSKWGTPNTEEYSKLKKQYLESNNTKYLANIVVVSPNAKGVDGRSIEVMEDLTNLINNTLEISTPAWLRIVGNKDKPLNEMKFYNDSSSSSGTSSYTGNRSYEREPSDDDKGFAWAVAEREVKQRLKAPSTAKFPFSYYGQYIKEVENDVFVVKSYVDAENSYGAKLRNNFMVKFKKTGSETYVVLDVQIY